MPIKRLIDRLFGRPEPPPAAPAKSQERHWISNPWHAVSIAPCKQACVPARHAFRVRYLSKQAPPLPLAGCTTRNCECRYRHHEDRRSSLRRSSDGLGPRKSWHGAERRAPSGRRESDRV